jgi:spermidine synthase
VETVMGDARLSLEREAAQGYDLLVLDAFSSDSVPAHLLTTQAFDIYRRHLAPGGLIAVNITNQYYDLRRPVAAQARRLGLSWAVIPYHPTSAGPRLDELRSTWMLLAADADLLSRPQIARSAQGVGTPGRDGRDADLDRALWTDDYSDLLAALK